MLSKSESESESQSTGLNGKGRVTEYIETLWTGMSLRMYAIGKY
jgi:hypothetical protein